MSQAGRNYEEVHDISSLKLANLLATMENLESLKLSSLLATYDQGRDKFSNMFDFRFRPKTGSGRCLENRKLKLSLESYNFINLSNNWFYEKTPYIITR